ncbi:MAG: hypothetical protein QOG62_657 [Thermoleophilaceae bacterium]|nr:hypothetical protein [Thermoleophilaceae bacterium]
MLILTGAMGIRMAEGTDPALPAKPAVLVSQEQELQLEPIEQTPPAQDRAPHIGSRAADRPIVTRAS